MRRLSFVAAMLAALSGVLEASSLDDGRRLLLEKRYPEAVAAFEREVLANPGSPEALLNLGWAFWHAKRFDDAARIGATLVNLDPGNRVFLVFRANTELERKDYQAAAGYARAALKAKPGDHDASMVLARALFLGGRRQEAMALLDRIVAAFPDDGSAVHRKAEFLFELGRKKEALAVLDALIAADPGHPAYRRSRAKFLGALGRAGDAKEEWRELARGGTDTQSLLNLAWAHWRDGNQEEAWKIASNLVKVDEQNPVFLRLLANLEIERMNYAQALRLARKAQALQPGDRDVELTLSKALFRLQREKEAMALLEKVAARHPEDLSVQFRWADSLVRTGSAERAIPVLERLLKAEPSNASYKMIRAVALYDVGRFEEAVVEWKGLAAGAEPNPDAVRRLRDDAFFRGAWDEAERWQRKIVAEDPGNPAGWEMLARVLLAQKEHGKALKALEKAVTADPLSINAFYMRAEILGQMRDWPGAQEAFTEVLKRNPGSIRAYDGLSYILEERGLYTEALESLRRIEVLIAPTVSPYIEIHKARILAAEGRYAAAHEPLRRMAAERQTPIPVLLYHGISRFDRGDSIPQETLRRHFRALKARGYQTLTASELSAVFRKERPLPPKPLLITFDDGRTDSFENADPVLKEVGFKATMFVHVSKLRKPYFHANPEEIARWQGTGRWEMQAHGFQAHDPLPIDGEGRQAHFLPNRMWLAGAGRLETVAEYRVRVADDYEKAKQGVEDMLPGHRVVAFAYPYGDYGQSDFSNTPESSGINQVLVRKNFHLAFVQEQYGINTLSSNPTDLRRFEVPRGMEAEELTGRLALSDPGVQAQLAEAHLWIRAGQLGRAKAIYADLEAQGIEEPRLWSDKGAALQMGGDLSGARALFAKAAEVDGEKTTAAGSLVRRQVEQSARAAAPVGSVGTQRFTDSDTNAVTKGALRGAGVYGALRYAGWAGEGSYSDRRHPAAPLASIRSREGGVDLRWFASPRLELEGSYVRRSFSRGASGSADNYSLSGGFQAFPALKLTVRDGQGNVETAAAVRAGRKFHVTGGGAGWDPALTWKVEADFDRTRFNDANVGQDVRVRTTKKATSWASLGAAFLNRDSKTTAPDYYSPRGLVQYTGFLTLSRPFGELNPRTGLYPVGGQLQYEGGVGLQAGLTRTVHSVKGTVVLRPFDRVSLSVDGQYGQSPTYASRRAGAALGVSF